MKERHYEVNVNVDYVEDLGSISDINCDQCDQTFKRSSLKRHCASVHNEAVELFQCSLCAKQFKRKDTLN